MKTIRKEFKSIIQAERYLNKLYNKYNHVHVVRWPCYSNTGFYIFEVK